MKRGKDPRKRRQSFRIPGLQRIAQWQLAFLGRGAEGTNLLDLDKKF